MSGTPIENSCRCMSDYCAAFRAGTSLTLGSLCLLLIRVRTYGRMLCHRNHGCTYIQTSDDYFATSWDCFARPLMLVRTSTKASTVSQTQYVNDDLRKDIPILLLKRGKLSPSSRGTSYDHADDIWLTQGWTASCPTLVRFPYRC